jgi:carbonic anhydrase
MFAFFPRTLSRVCSNNAKKFEGPEENQSFLSLTRSQLHKENDSLSERCAQKEVFFKSRNYFVIRGDKTTPLVFTLSQRKN